MTQARAWVGARNQDPPRTPSLRQIQETECGIAALAIVLAHYGAWVPYPELRRHCQVSDLGVTALSLVRAARHYGLILRGVRLGVDSLPHVQAPVILFWERWHFLVLEGIRGDTAWVNDPARGHRTLSLDALKKGYSGIALIAQPGPDFQRVGSARQPLKTAVGMLSPGRWPLALMGMSALAESIMVPLAVELVGTTMSNEHNGRARSARRLPFAMAGIGIAGALRIRAARTAHGAIAREIRRKTGGHGWETPQSEHAPQAAMIPNRIGLADCPAITAVHGVTAGLRMTVAVPLFVLILGRVHPAVALVALPGLAAPFLLQQPTARFLPGARFRDGLPDNAWVTTLSPVLQPLARLSPAVAAGILVSTNRTYSVITVLLGSQVAFRMVDRAVEAVDMLYQLPESIVQLSDIDRFRDASGKAVD